MSRKPYVRRTQPTTAELHRRWLQLVDTDGPFLSIPVLKRVYPQGISTLATDILSDLKAAKDPFEKAWDAWSTGKVSLAEFRSARDAWVDVVFRRVFGWGPFLTTDVSPTTIVSPNHKVTLTSTGAFRRNGETFALTWVIDPVRSLRDLADDGWATDTIDRMELMLRQAGVSIGVVTDGRPGPLGEMMVVVIDSDGRAFGATTGSDGRYLVDGLAPGGYRVVTVDPSGQRAAGPAVSVTVTSGQSAAADLSLDAPSVTVETSAGWPLEEFPFPVMVAPPHRPHDPVTGFAAATVDSGGAWRFETPPVTSPDGLYGNFWVTPRPPTPGARLAGVRFVDASWEGQSANSIVVFSLLDRAVENNATGTVTGAVQGLPGELVGVLFDRQSDTIDMLLDEPAAVPEGRFVAAVDTENLPMGDPETVFPSRIDVGRVEWLWAPTTQP